MSKLFVKLVLLLFLKAIIVQNKGQGHTSIHAKQARQLLTDLADGLWEFPALLDLNEVEVDSIAEEVIDIMELSKELKEDQFVFSDELLLAKRLQDCDSLKYKLMK